MQHVHAAALGCSGKVVSGSWSAMGSHAFVAAFSCACRSPQQSPARTWSSFAAGEQAGKEVSKLLFVMPLLY